MHSCKKPKTQSADFIYCCCRAVIVRYVVGPSLFTDSILVSKTVFKNVYVAGMAVRLNMSLALLCSHINKSTHNDCKPEKTLRPEKSTATYIRLHLQLRTSRWRSNWLINKRWHRSTQSQEMHGYVTSGFLGETNDLMVLECYSDIKIILNAE